MVKNEFLVVVTGFLVVGTGIWVDFTMRVVKTHAFAWFQARKPLRSGRGVL